MKRILQFLFLIPCLAASTHPAAGATPNVLFIVCDDLNTHVSSSGYPHIHTPNFDTLASTGMTFTRAYCQYPVCGPSRASFLHGLYPQTTGVTDNSTRIEDRRPGSISLPQRFKASGYWTGAVGKVFHREPEPSDIAWHERRRFENDEMPIEKAAREAAAAEERRLSGRDADGRGFAAPLIAPTVGRRSKRCLLILHQEYFLQRGCYVSIFFYR